MVSCNETQDRALEDSEDTIALFIEQATYSVLLKRGSEILAPCAFNFTVSLSFTLNLSGGDYI